MIGELSSKRVLMVIPIIMMFLIRNFKLRHFHLLEIMLSTGLKNTSVPQSTDMIEAMNNAKRRAAYGREIITIQNTAQSGGIIDHMVILFVQHVVYLSNSQIITINMLHWNMLIQALCPTNNSLVDT